MTKKEIYNKYGFTHKDNIFQYDRNSADAKCLSPHYFVDGKIVEQDKSFVITAFNFLGIKELTDITFIVPANPEYEVNEVLLYVDFLVHDPCLCFSCGSSQIKSWFYSLFASLIEEDLNKYGLSLTPCLNYKYAEITPLLMAIMTGKEYTSLFVYNIGILKIPFTTMIRLWPQVKEEIYRQHGLHNTHAPKRITNLYFQISEQFSKSLYACPTSNEAEAFICKFKQSHFRVGENGEQLFFVGNTLCLPAPYYEQHKIDTYSFSETELVHKENTMTTTEHKLLEIDYVVPPRCYETSTFHTISKLINDTLAPFTGIKFSNDENCTLGANLLRLNLIKLFEGRQVFPTPRVCEYSNDTNIFFAASHKTNVVVRYYNIYFAIPVKEACNMWSTFKSFICEQLICDQLKRNQYQECDMGISYSQFVIYRTQLKNARFGVQAASVILHYKAKVAKQSSLNP